MKVSDIMTKEVITVQKNTTLKEAASLLAKFRIHGMPVVDDEKKVIGIITESDFFTRDSSNIYLPTFLDFISAKGAQADVAEEAEKNDAEKTRKVQDIMTENCNTIKSDLSVRELVTLFKESQLNSLPVVDNNGILSGIVTVMDVIKLL